MPGIIVVSQDSWADPKGGGEQGAQLFITWKTIYSHVEGSFE